MDGLTGGTWKYNGRDAVVSDRPDSPHGKESLKYYGGHVVCESIQRTDGMAVAALPEMIAALEATLARDTGQRQPCGHSHNCACAVKAVGAALAKARGDAPAPAEPSQLVIRGPEPGHRETVIQNDVAGQQMTPVVRAHVERVIESIRQAGAIGSVPDGVGVQLICRNPVQSGICYIAAAIVIGPAMCRSSAPLMVQVLGMVGGDVMRPRAPDVPK